MKALEPLIFLFGSILIAAGSSAITAAFYRRRAVQASKQAWRSAEIYFTRRAHDHASK